MGLLFVGMLVIAAGPVGENPAKRIEALRVPSEVYWASYQASGARLCDRNLRERQEQRFDQRYGKRVSALITVIETENKAKHEGDDLIVTSDCLAFSSSRDAEEALSSALDAFDPTLGSMERKHGLRRLSHP